MMSDRLTITSVHWNENIRVLRTFRNTLKTSMGPEGCAKAFVTGGDILQLAVTSKSLLARLELEHPVCRYIGHVASGLADFGLYFGVMVSHLLEQLWSEESLSKQVVSKNVQYLLAYIQRMLSSDLVCKKVDFSTVNSFLPLVKTVIASKCPSLLFDVDLDKLCFEIVRTFLNCLDHKTNSVGRVFIKVETGPNYFSSHDGLLYKIIEDHDIKIIKELEGEVKVLIFSLKLDCDDAKGRSLIVNQVLPILKEAVKENVRLVACQKTVAAEIKLYLMKQKVVLLDRMGTDLTETLLHTSQGFCISHLGFDSVPDINRLVGMLTSVKMVHFNESSYVLLQNKNVSVGTLLIQNYCLAGTTHLTVLTNQAFSALRYLTLHPALTFGAGCLEIWLIAQIHILKESKKDKELRAMSGWVQRALLSACGPAPPDFLDSVYHHAWACKAPRCRCGCVSAGQVQDAGGLLIPLTELVTSQSARHVTLTSPRQTEQTLSPDVLVDSHQQKLNVIVSAFETFANISDIGLIVFTHIFARDEKKKTRKTFKLPWVDALCTSEEWRHFALDYHAMSK